MRGEPTLKAQTLVAEVGLLSLLSQNAAIRRLVVSRPVIELLVDAQGRRSWDFAAADAGRVRLAQAAHRAVGLAARRYRRPAPGGAQLAAALEKLFPTSVRVVDGTVRYTDERAGVRHEFASLELELVASDIGGPLDARGQISLGAARGWRSWGRCRRSAPCWRSGKGRLTFKLAGPADRSHLRRSAGRCLRAGARRTCQRQGSFGARSGRLAWWPDRRRTARSWCAEPVELARRCRRPGVACAADGDARRHLARRRADHRNQGRAAPPQRQSASVGARLRPRPDSPRAARSAAARRRPQRTRSTTSCGATALPAKAPQVRGFTKRAGGGLDWSDERIDFSPLGLADADLALSVDRLVYKDVKTGRSRLSLSPQGSRGQGRRWRTCNSTAAAARGHLRLDGSGEVPTTTNLTLEGVSALPLLKDAAGLRLARGAQHDRLVARRPGPLRAADRSRP